ncbi:MAG: hypothetical protein EOP84_22140 [Verrucomicrobiaceae bacterium]|nr:MAG: hypothetical protein EOP84_22140 [Verrucomicrobiaceae bacterium]
MLFPEAKLLGGAGLGEVTKWTVATIAGLGAYDTVTGATEIQQVYPASGEQIVPAFTGVPLNFIFQVVNTPSNDKVSWSVSGLPPGLDHQDLSTPSTHLINGTPTEEGSTTVTVTAWEMQNQMGASFPQEFVIEIGPPIITSQPASVAVASGTKATLSVTGDPNGGTLTYRWYKGISGNEIDPIPNAAGAGPSYTTPQNQTASNTPANFWVKVTKNGVSQNSNTTTVTIATSSPAITTQPASTTIPSGTTATLTVGVSGSSPTIQWYRGNAGVTTNPVSGATSTTFTTPALTTTTSYWARATNGLGTASSNAATVTIGVADPFEEWRASQFNSTQLANPQISGPTADPDGDGIPNQDEYVFGTSPLTREQSPLTFSINNGTLSLGFTARQATGPGYSSKTRHYSLETRSTLTSGSWTPVTGFSDIVGNNQPVTHSTPAAVPRAFYTLRVWLTP